MVRKNSIWVFVAAVVILPVSVFAVVKWYEHTFTKLPVLGGEKHTVANFSLVNQHGTTTSLNNWDQKIAVVDFFFTHCTSICPKMARSLKSVQQQFAGDPELLLNSFSVDPERDSVGQLQH
jgi:protein SCO1/2